MVVGVLLDSSVLRCYGALGTFGRSGINPENNSKKAGTMPKIRLGRSESSNWEGKITVGKGQAGTVLLDK